MSIKIVGRKKNKRRQKRIILIALSLILIFIVVSCMIFIDNKNIDYEELSVDYVPGGSEVKIAHLSDLHFPRLKVDLDGLRNKLTEIKIDLIAITGDTVDDGADISSCGAVEYLEKLNEIAPVYYVNGNHETRHGENIRQFYEKLRQKQIAVLDNQSVITTVRGKNITIIGLSDGAEHKKEYLEDRLFREGFKLLIAHRPEKIQNYIDIETEYCPDLILTGHAHGGQFRFFGKGLIAPNQGLFPKYDSGMYSFKAQDNEKNVNMVVSRGIGNSFFPFRFNNKPNVPIISVFL